MRMTAVTKHNKYDIKIIILFIINYVYYIPHWSTRLPGLSSSTRYNNNI